MQANATLQNDRQATVDQLRAFIKLMTLHGQRILHAKVENGYLKICYSTQSGYFFVLITYNQYGEEMNKQHFKGWDAECCEPVEPINFQE